MPSTGIISFNRLPRRVACGLLLGAAVAAVFPGLAGCRHESPAEQLKAEGFDQHPVGVAPEARLVRHNKPEGGGIFTSPDKWFASDNITFKPEHSGRVWVVNEQNATVVFRGTLRAGDELRVNPKTNDVLVNRAKVNSRRLPEDVGMLIYFAPDAGPASAPATQNTNSSTNTTAPPGT